MDVALVVNPASGKGRGAAIGASVASRLRAAGLGVRELAGRDGDEALDLCRAAVADGAGALVAVGGDGMVHLALQAVAGTATPLGVVPAGTGNDFARALDLGDDPVGVVTAGRTRRVDAVRAAGKWFGCVLGAGFDSVVNERANRMRWPRGRRRYDLAIAAELPRFRPRPFRLVLDGEVWETDAMLVAVGNAQSYGAGMRVTPDAEIDDGLLDVFVLGPVSKVEFVRTFPKVFTGTHVSHPAVTIRRAKVVEVGGNDLVAYADGERYAPLPITCECVPGALAVLSP